MLIGLAGKAKSGKDSAYQFIKEWAESEGRPVRRDAFADRLKLSAARALGFKGSPEEAITFCNHLKDPAVGIAVIDSGVDFLVQLSGRQFLQWYGTEAHREIFGDSFWIDAVLDRYDSDELLVVTDVRFPNEAQAILDAGGTMWQLYRPGTLITEDAHASEQPLPDLLINETLINNRDLSHLRELIHFLLDEVFVT